MTVRKTTIILIFIICFGISNVVLAQDNERTSPIVGLSKEVRTGLKAVQTIAIFLNGNDALLTRIIEDALAIHLTNAGLGVVNRESLEKTVGEQIAKQRKEANEGAINALEIGKAVSANVILTGAVFIASGEQQSLLIKIASFQLVDVENGITLINVLFESEKGQSFSEVSRTFVEILKQNKG